jgi:hypothetical protein
MEGKAAWKEQKEDVEENLLGNRSRFTRDYLRIRYRSIPTRYNSGKRTDLLFAHKREKELTGMEFLMLIPFIKSFMNKV